MIGKLQYVRRAFFGVASELDSIPAETDAVDPGSITGHMGETTVDIYGWGKCSSLENVPIVGRINVI